MINKTLEIQIHNMKAGKEIDEMNADKLFGVKFIKPKHGTWCTCQTCGWDYDNCMCGWSTDSDKAWEILAMMGNSFFIDGYGLFCYHCGYFSRDEGHCTTGWKNKVAKDVAVLDYLGLKPGSQTRLEDLQKMLAEKVSYGQLEEFCGPGGPGKCEFYALGVCQKAYAALREKYGIKSE